MDTLELKVPKDALDTHLKRIRVMSTVDKDELTLSSIKNK